MNDNPRNAGCLTYFAHLEGFPVSFNLAPGRSPKRKKGLALSRPVPHLTSWPNYFLTFAFLARAADP